MTNTKNLLTAFNAHVLDTIVNREEREELISLYSDLYKDLNGVRPRPNFRAISTARLRHLVASVSVALSTELEADFTPIVGEGWAVNAAPLRASLEVICGS